MENHGFKIHKWTGELVHTQPTPKYDPTAPAFNGHRGELHTIIFNYAKDELGIPIHLGQRVTEYFEDENQAGIVLESGERVSFDRFLWDIMGLTVLQVTADMVVGADGVRSKARQLVLGYNDKPKSSGYAVFRAWSVQHLDEIQLPYKAHNFI